MKRLGRGDDKEKVRRGKEQLEVPFGIGDLPTPERRLDGDASTTTATTSKGSHSTKKGNHLCNEAGNGNIVPELFPDRLEPPDPSPNALQRESNVSIPGALAVPGPGAANASRQIALNQEEGRSPILNQEEEQSQILLNAVLVDDEGNDNNASTPPMPMAEAVAIDPDGNKKARRIMMAVAVLLVTASIVVVVVVLVVVAGGRQNERSNADQAGSPQGSSPVPTVLSTPSPVGELEDTNPPSSTTPYTDQPSVSPTDSSFPTEEPSVSPTTLEPTASPTTPLAQRLALVELFGTTNDATWNVDTHWNSETVPECEGWYGVSCGNGLVTGISLDDNNLHGSLTTRIGDLTNLRELDLYKNQLTGPIPTEMGRLAALTNLNLGRNSLDGNIPSELGNLSQLTTLGLEKNILQGPLPQALKGMSQLRVLDVDSNALLSGSIPDEYGDMTKLRTLDVSNTNITGSMPIEMCAIESLEEVAVACDEFFCGYCRYCPLCSESYEISVETKSAVDAGPDGTFDSLNNGVESGFYANNGYHTMQDQEDRVVAESSRLPPLPLGHSLTGAFVTGRQTANGWSTEEPYVQVYAFIGNGIVELDDATRVDENGTLVGFLSKDDTVNLDVTDFVLGIYERGEGYLGMTFRQVSPFAFSRFTDLSLSLNIDVDCEAITCTCSDAVCNWELPAKPSGASHYAIFSNNPSKDCLVVKDGSTAECTPVVIGNCTDNIPGYPSEALWWRDDLGFWHPYLDNSMCMQAGCGDDVVQAGTGIHIGVCDINNKNQWFGNSIRHNDALSLEKRPDLCADGKEVGDTVVLEACDGGQDEWNFNTGTSQD